MREAHGEQEQQTRPERRPHGTRAGGLWAASSSAAAETERGPRAPRRRPSRSRKRPPRSSLLRGRGWAAPAAQLGSQLPLPAIIPIIPIILIIPIIPIIPGPQAPPPRHTPRPAFTGVQGAPLGDPGSKGISGLARSAQGNSGPSPGRVAQARVEEAGHPYVTQARPLLKGGRLMEAY